MLKISLIKNNTKKPNEQTKNKQKKKIVNQVCNTPNFLLHRTLGMRCTQGKRRRKGIIRYLVVDKNLVQAFLGVHTVFVSLFRCC